MEKVDTQTSSKLINTISWIVFLVRLKKTLQFVCLVLIISYCNSSFSQSEDYRELIDGNVYSVELPYYTSTFSKFYIPKNGIFVICYNGNTTSDDVDIFAFEDDSWLGAMASAEQKGNKDILYFMGEGKYYYFRISNKSSGSIKGKLNTYLIKYDEIIAQTAIEYALQNFAKELIMSMLEIDEEDTTSVGVADTAANIIVSHINGIDNQGIAKNAIVSNVLNEIKSTLGTSEIATFLIACVINIFNSIYYYY